MVSTDLFSYCIVQCKKTQSLLFPNRMLFYYTIAINISKDTILKRATKSLLEELNAVAIKKDGEAVIESRATHVINSAINLLSMIKENFPPDQAYELERRFLNSIRGGDPAKFTRGIRKLRDAKDTARNLKIIEGDVKDDD